jgi:Glycosyl hydrolase family 12
VPRSRKTRVVVAMAAVIALGGAAACSSGGGSSASAVRPPSSASAPASTGAASASGSQASSALCKSQRLAVAGGAYMVQNDEWGSGAPECLATVASGGFTITSSAIAKSANGAPGGYPSIYRGCHWGICTPGSGLPVPVSKLLSPGTVTTTWDTAQPDSGTYDVAYDIWFNQAPATNGQPDGAELMIWLNHRGSVRPYGSQVATATVAGHSFQVWFGQQGWNTISYSMVPGITSVQNLDIGQFVADAISRGYIQKSWYLIDVEAGFELWQGGAGLATHSFAVNVAG